MALESSAGHLRTLRAQQWGSPLRVLGRFLLSVWWAKEVCVSAYACLNQLNPPARRFAMCQCITLGHWFLFRCWRCCPSLPGHVNAPYNQSEAKLGGALGLPPSHPRGTGRDPTHLQDEDGGSVPAAGRAGAPLAHGDIPSEELGSANGVLLTTWGWLARAWAVSRDPSLAKRVPPHTAERQEQPADGLETPLAPPATARSWQGRSRARLPQGWIREGGFLHVLSATVEGSPEQGGRMGRGSLSLGSANPPLCNPGGVFKGQPTVEA